MGTEKRQRQKANRAQKHQQAVRQQSRRTTTRRILIGVGAIVGVFLVAWIASNFVGDDDPVTPVDSVLEPVETVAPDAEAPDSATTLPAAGTVPGTTGG